MWERDKEFVEKISGNNKKTMDDCIKWRFFKGKEHLEYSLAIGEILYPSM